MSDTIKTKIPEIIKKFKDEILNMWLKEQLTAVNLRPNLLSRDQLEHDSKEFWDIFLKAVQTGNLIELKTPEWEAVRQKVANLSRTRTKKGFTVSETSTFIFSLKQPIFKVIFSMIKSEAELLDDIWNITLIIDKLGLYCSEIYQKSREEIILRQQQEVLELSIPVVKVWKGIVAVPIIGTLDSARTQVVMESLLTKIVETSSSIAIIDITGVPTVDTQVAQHLLKTVSATKLMGADCIISGIRPQIAQTMVQLGVNLKDVITKSTLEEALKLAFQKIGLLIPKDIT